MANQYAKGTVQLLVRLDEELKMKFYDSVQILNDKSYGAPYSANSVMRGLIEMFIHNPEILRNPEVPMNDGREK